MSVAERGVVADVLPLKQWWKIVEEKALVSAIVTDYVDATPINNNNINNSNSKNNNTYNKLNWCLPTLPA